jgi:ribosomal protein S5
MKSVLDFLQGHQLSEDIIILGQCPSTKVTPSINGTFNRLKKWMMTVGVRDWDFHNVIPNKINSYDINDVDVDALYRAVEGKGVVIALGGFVQKVCNKYGIDNYKIDHPSPRNRNLNSMEYEANMLHNLKEHIDVARANGVL